MKKAIGANGASFTQLESSHFGTQIANAVQLVLRKIAAKSKAIVLEIQISQMQTVIANMTEQQLDASNLKPGTPREQARALLLGNDA